MKDLSKTELLIMKCVWGSDRPVTATQIQQILLEKYQTELDRRSLGTLMYRLDQKGYVNVDVSTRVNLYTAKVKEEEARKKKGREILSSGITALLISLSQIFTVQRMRTKKITDEKERQVKTYGNIRVV